MKMKKTIGQPKLVLHRIGKLFGLSLWVLGILSCAHLVAQEASEKITFDDHVKPIFMQRCSSCHNGQKREGDVDLTNYTNMMQGGGSGAVIEPQDASASYLYNLITHEDSPEMPPSGTKIPEPEIQLIAKWINLGALENKGSKAAKPKPKLDMGLSETPTQRPEILPIPLRMPLEPVIKTARPSVLAIATSPWAPITAISSPKQILLYNTTTLQLIGILPFEEGIAHSLRFSRNGQLLLAGGGRDGASGQTVLFNVITGERITTVGEELESVLASDISANHELIALGGPNKLVKVHSTNDGSLVFEIAKHTDWVTALEFSPDGEFLATGDRNGGLHIWEALSGNEVFTLKGHSKSITGISWRSDSKVVASVSEDTTIRTWEMKNGTQLKSWGGHGVGSTSIEFQRDGNLVSCGRDKVAKVWDSNGKMLKQFAGLSDVAVAVSYCDESKRVIAGDWAGNVRVWNAEDAKHLGNLKPNPPRLAERLSTAKQWLSMANQKHAPLAEKAVTVKSQVDALGSSLEQTKQTKVQIQTKLSQSEKQLADTQKQFESTNAQHTLWRTERDAKNAVLPLIKESLDKAAAAAKALPDDAELKTASTTLANKLKQIGDRVTELNALVAKSDQEKTTTKTQMDLLTKSVQATKTEMQTVTSQVTKLQNDFGAMTEQLKKDNAAVAEAKALVDRATELVNRWNNDIQFITTLTTLNQNLTQTQKVVDEKQAAVDQANQQLTVAKSVVDQAVQQKSAIEKQAEAIKQQVLELRQKK